MLYISVVNNVLPQETNMVYKTTRKTINPQIVNVPSSSVLAN